MTTPGMHGRSVARIDGESASSAAEGSPDAKPATSATTWEHCGTKSAKALPQESRSSYRGSRNWKVKKEILTEMPSREIWQLDAAELSHLIRVGKISSREAVDACLRRREQTHPHVNAVVLTFDDQARIDADAADTALRRGEPTGPLHGVPVTIKVNTDQCGCPNDNGLVAFRDSIAAKDNPVVANLRRAGAVIIGRTNAPAFSMRWFTDNALYGRTSNPWIAEKTPGGSSGGAAVAVATGVGPIAHGSDFAGSVRYPAFCCGVVGLKPTYGRVPAFNHSSSAPIPISRQLMAVHGPLARRVGDIRLAFNAMAISDLSDPHSLDVSPPPCGRPGLRVALAANPGARGVNPTIADNVRKVGNCLAAAGYHVEETEPPFFNEAAELWPALAMPDTIAQLEPAIAQFGDDGVRRAMELLRECWPQRDADICLAALAERLRLLRAWQEFLEVYPIIVTPTSKEFAFEWDEDVRDKETTARILAAQAPLMAVSVLGLPALAMPTGLHKGLPLGIQIIAGRYQEELCFDVGAVIEAHIPMPTPIDPVPLTSRP